MIVVCLAVAQTLSLYLRPTKKKREKKKGGGGGELCGQKDENGKFYFSASSHHIVHCCKCEHHTYDGIYLVLWYI